MGERGGGEELCWNLNNLKNLKLEPSVFLSFLGQQGLTYSQLWEQVLKYVSQTRCMKRSPGGFHPGHGCAEQVPIPTKKLVPELTSKPAKKTIYDFPTVLVALN